jgi:riboflavin kinase / FMN adenylyltransferase
MQVVYSLSDIEFNKYSVVTVGTFDGIHLGHKEIIRELKIRSKNISGRSVLITFDPHPREVVGRGPTKLLTTIDERLEIFNKSGIDLVFVINFTFEFSRLPYDQFYSDYIYNKIGVDEVIVGHDHMFGRDREANIDKLKELGKQLGFKVDQIPPVVIDGELICSSKIRDILLRGDVSKAENFLGHPYSLNGRVVSGEGRGKIIGFPTANVEPIFEKKLVPAEGVYFVSVIIQDRKHYGMLNIGVRPTFQTSSHRVIEVNIFDFASEIYDKEVTILFHKRIRSEKKFASKEDLTQQLILDKQICENYINQIN